MDPLNRGFNTEITAKMVNGIYVMFGVGEKQPYNLHYNSVVSYKNSVSYYAAYGYRLLRTSGNWW